jgi:hypothetical protein
LVFDAGCGLVKLQRCLEGLEPRPVGRPRRPGRQQLRPAPPRDLDSPSTERRYQNEYYGSMRVKAWSGLHPKTRRIDERYGCERAPVIRGTVIHVEVGKHSARPASRSTVALVLRRRGAGLGNAHRPCRGSLLSRPIFCHLRVTLLARHLVATRLRRSRLDISWLRTLSSLFVSVDAPSSIPLTLSVLQFILVH